MPIKKREIEEFPHDPDGWPLREGSYAKIEGQLLTGLLGPDTKLRGPDHYGIISFIYRDTKGWLIEVIGGGKGVGWKDRTPHRGRPEYTYLRSKPKFNRHTDAGLKEGEAYDKLKRDYEVLAQRRRKPKKTLTKVSRGAVRKEAK